MSMEKSYQVGVVELRGSASFLAEAVYKGRILGVVAMNDFEGDFPVHLSVAGVVNGGKAAPAQFLQQFILAEGFKFGHQATR